VEKAADHVEHHEYHREQGQQGDHEQQVAKNVHVGSLPFGTSLSRDPQIAHRAFPWLNFLIAAMLRLYGAADARHEELLQLARQARRRSSLDVEFQGLPTRAFASYEAAALAIDMYQVLLVPGLLQIEDYARAVLRVLRPGLEPLDIEDRIELRMTQQATVLQRPDPPSFHAVLDEAVLRRPVGSAEIMKQQLKRLVERSEDENITLQVLRFATGEHAGMDGAFVILGFGTVAEPGVVYLEHTTNDFLLEKADAVARYRALFAHLCEQALDPGDSRSLISKALRDL
jgi:Domain of unknown function (DUF5753)